ncbi:hypothetical protein PENTCL1PPCAC_6141, partial [Pristionchus entomophagus]
DDFIRLSVDSLSLKKTCLWLIYDISSLIGEDLLPYVHALIKKCLRGNDEASCRSLPIFSAFVSLLRHCKHQQQTENEKTFTLLFPVIVQRIVYGDEYWKRTTFERLTELAECAPA